MMPSKKAWLFCAAAGDLLVFFASINHLPSHNVSRLPQPKSFKRTFLWVLFALAGLVIAGIVALQVHLSDQEWSGTEINVARRQQALAGNVLSHAMVVAHAKEQGAEYGQSVKDLRQAVITLENGYMGLVGGSQDFQLDGEHSVEVMDLLNEVDPYFNNILEDAQTVLDAEEGTNLSPAVARLSEDTEAFGRKMDFVVHEFIQENRSQMTLTSNLYWVLGGLLLMGLALSFLLILRPLVNRLQRQNRELINLNANLENVNRIKGDFLANMSHEIRTPLNGVIGMGELLGKTKLTEQQSDYRNTIQRSAENLLVILDDILDYSKLDAGNMRLVPEPFDLHQCMEDVIDVMKPSASSRGLELAYYIDPDIPHKLMQDEHRFKQILFNLIGNAVKFTEQGEVEVTLKLTNTHGDLIQLECSIRDTGIGMDPRVIPNLFNSFTQEDTSTTRRFGGTGLGLAICKELVGLMGGRIWANSEKGKGATFSFTLVAEKTDAVQDFSYKSVQGLKVVVVDDNMTNLKILVKQLSNWGIQATPFNSPNLVLEVLDNLDKFDLCLLDMQMPEMDGHQLTRRIREKYDAVTLPIVLLSSVGQSFLKDEEGLYNRYLTKPVKQARLLRTIQNVSGASEEAQVLKTVSRGNATFKDLNHDDLRILIAEDNELQQAVTTRNLQMLGYSAQCAFNGQEVLEKMNKHTFDLILMDLDMPLLDGLQTTRKIKSLYTGEDAPVIIGLSDGPRKGNQKALRSHGMDDVLRAPFDADELDKKIRHWFPYSARY